MSLGPWTKTSHRCWTSGAYSVTGHEYADKPGFFYIAWDRKSELGLFDDAAGAKGACFGHSEREGS